jgi:hypothetical protein
MITQRSSEVDFKTNIPLVPKKHNENAEQIGFPFHIYLGVPGGLP